MQQSINTFKKIILRYSERWKAVQSNSIITFWTKKISWNSGTITKCRTLKIDINCISYAKVSLEAIMAVNCIFNCSLNLFYISNLIYQGSFPDPKTHLHFSSITFSGILIWGYHLLFVLFKFRETITESRTD